MSRTSTMSRPRWPDGRLVHPGEDRQYYSIVCLIFLPLALAQFWLIGHFDLVGVRIEAYTGIVLSLLLAVGAACEVVSTRRVWALADAVTDNDSGGDRGLMSRLWRAPRWSDGRLISHGEDNLAMATRAMGVLLLLVLSWACGSADIPDIYVDANLSILPGLLGGPIGLTVYWMTRRCIVIANKAATKAEVAN